MYFLAIICGNVYAQGTKSMYKVLENNFSGSKEIAGREYESGQTILIKEASSFYLQRARKGTKTTERVNNKYGQYEVDSLYRIAQNERNARNNGKVSNPSFQIKGTDSTLYSFTRKIVNLFDGQMSSIMEYGTVECKRDNQKIFVKNTSDNDDMFVDVIWTRNGICMSALSFSRDFANNKVLYPGETIECEINEYVAGERLFVVCTPWPIAYNTIDLNQAKEQDMTYDMDIPLTIVPINDL